ncbi:MAG: hypothetical protein RL134_2581 [Actinomycetota bacterium]|jgi:hypothetical protein
MATRVVLHIGPRKTATTYLQRVLQTLVLDGQLDPTVYPITTRDRTDHNQVPGLIDLARDAGAIGLQDDAWRDQDGSDARALVEAVRAAPGPVILSAEAMSVLPPEGAQAVIAAFAPAPVDVIVTARDLGRVLPSSWQQHMRNGNYESYADYLGLRVEERESRSYATELRRGFWRAYRYVDLATRWQDAGAHSVSVVTVPGAGAPVDTVWRRFLEVVRVPDLPEVPPGIAEDRSNISLTGAETFAIYGFNLAARAEGQGRREVRAAHRALIRRGWLNRPDRGPRLGLPQDLRPLIARWAAEDSDELAGSGIPVVGDLADLAVPQEGEDGVPTADQVARAAGAALALRGRRSREDDD